MLPDTNTQKHVGKCGGHASKNGGKAMSWSFSAMSARNLLSSRSRTWNIPALLQPRG